MAEPILHQRIFAPFDEGSPLVDQPALGRNPRALRGAGQELPEPPEGASLRPGERALGATPFGESTRPDSWQPDLDTGQVTVPPPGPPPFSPSVAPHERLGAVDVIAEDFSLRRSTALRPVSVGGRVTEGSELFWGSALAQVAGDRPVPLPSVAPHERILSVRTRPERPVRFYRDGADNLFVTAQAEGPLRLVWVVEVPPSYFGGPLPRAATADDLPASARPQLPRPVAEAAGEVRRHLGLDPAAPVARNLARLVSYLRRFDGGELPASPGLDPYRQLALGRRGVCRHRAYVFVVTAQSLGLPAQLVENEVHAFAEVLLPEAGWLRVDLGGQVVEGLDEVAGPVHQPQRQDPFAWPDSAGRSRRSARRRGQRSPSVETSRSGSRNGSFSPGEPQPTVAAPRRSEWRRALPPDGESSAVAPEPIAPEPAWSVRLDTPRPRVLRGEPLLVTGQVEYDGQGTAVAAVEVRVVHYSQGAETILGLLPVGDEGRFRGELAVPSTLVVGRYSLLVRVVPDWQSVNEDRVATPR